jgi:hypothetical protein
LKPFMIVILEDTKKFHMLHYLFIFFCDMKTRGLSRLKTRVFKEVMFLKPRYLFEPPAWFYPRILVGAGEMLTPAFFVIYGITHVINCAYPEHSPDWFKTSFPDRYACLNAEDSLTSNILDWYPTL